MARGRSGARCRSTSKTHCRKLSFRADCSGRQRSRFISPATVSCSVPSWKQPRWPTRNPTRASWTERSGGGAKYLGRGSAALTRTMAAGRKISLRLFQFPVVVYLFCISFLHPVSAQQIRPSQKQQFVIQRIDFVGNRRIQRDTLLARIFSRAGDPYTE